MSSSSPQVTVGPRRQVVLDLYRKGTTNAREIGLEMGISTQAVYKHLDALRALGLLDDRKAS